MEMHRFPIPLSRFFVFLRYFTLKKKKKKKNKTKEWITNTALQYVWKQRIVFSYHTFNPQINYFDETLPLYLRLSIIIQQNVLDPYSKGEN